CVNSVGVELNTASLHLLSHVSGIGPALARNIVEHRNSKGLFRSRKQLLDVSRFSQKAFEQATGFLRIREGENPPDDTSHHPERSPVREKPASELAITTGHLVGGGAKHERDAEERRAEIGECTYQDIHEEVEKPGRDPGDQCEPYQSREDIHEVKD